jgi:hypothetical protein
MNCIADAETRLGQATELAGVLDAAYDAFEIMLAVLRRHQEDDAGAFAAFVFAACSAADGRDWIAGAPALPPASSCEPAQGLLEGASVTDVALAISALSGELATRLAVFGRGAADPDDRTCCEHAAAEAATIQSLLGGAGPP